MWHLATEIAPPGPTVGEVIFVLSVGALLAGGFLLPTRESRLIALGCAGALLLFAIFA